MKNRYEGLLVLNTRGNDENVREMVERLEAEFKKEGAEVEQVQKMEKRQFTYVAGPLDSGFFVNFIFQADPPVLEKLRTRLKLDPDVYRQHFQRLAAKTEKKAPAPKLAETH